MKKKQSKNKKTKKAPQLQNTESSLSSLTESKEQTSSKISGKAQNGYTQVNPFETAIREFTVDLTALHHALPLAYQGVQQAIVGACEELEHFVANVEHTVHHEGHKIEYTFKPPRSHSLGLRRTESKLLTALHGPKVVMASFLIAFVSKFDAYLGNLARAIFLSKPEVLKASDKSLKPSEILKFGTIDDAKNFIIEEEVEALLRKSHPDQLTWLNTKINLNLDIQKKKILQDFIEITQRRNLFAHTNGIVSSSYASNCLKYGIKLDDNIKVGSLIELNLQYLKHAFNVIYQVGLMLGHISWRKLNEDQLVPNNILLMNGYDLLVQQEYGLVIDILEFALNENAFTKSMNEETTLANTINLAQAYMRNGDSKSMDMILNKYEWTAKNPRFQQAYFCLTGNYTKAARLMHAINDSESPLAEEDYREWPLFAEFREQKVFLETYKQIFGKEYEEKLSIPNDFPRISQQFEQALKSKQLSLETQEIPRLK